MWQIKCKIQSLTILILSVFLIPGAIAIFPFGPAFVFQTSSRPPTNNSAGTFTSNISFDAITNVSNVVVAVSQTMGRSLDNPLEDSTYRHVNSSVFLFKDGNWTTYKLRKRRSTFDLAREITNQVFTAVNSFINTTANQTTFDLMDRLLNASAINNRESRQVSHDLFSDIELLDEDSRDFLYDIESSDTFPKYALHYIQRVLLKLRRMRNTAWQQLSRTFNHIFQVVDETVNPLYRLFNEAADNMTEAMGTAGKCWPTEQSLTPLSDLFRSAAQNMGLCQSKSLIIGSSILENMKGNLSVPFKIPSEIAQQFNYCNSITTVRDAFGVLTESVCYAKIPILFHYFDLNAMFDNNHIIEEGQKLMIHLKGSMLQCALNELNSIQDTTSDWNTAYRQCIESGTNSP